MRNFITIPLAAAAVLLAGCTEAYETTTGASSDAGTHQTADTAAPVTPTDISADAPTPDAVANARTTPISDPAPEQTPTEEPSDAPACPDWLRDLPALAQHLAAQAESSYETVDTAETGANTPAEEAADTTAACPVNLGDLPAAIGDVEAMIASVEEALRIQAERLEAERAAEEAAERAAAEAAERAAREKAERAAREKAERAAQETTTDNGDCGVRPGDFPTDEQIACMFGRSPDAGGSDEEFWPEGPEDYPPPADYEFEPITGPNTLPPPPDCPTWRYDSETGYRCTS